ncbi:MAG: hypothetical protein MJY58_06850, partial [Bacteroidaceae bacterium]|nr:hypothetical protein [Bacteroidaceae bacterium]
MKGILKLAVFGIAAIAALSSCSKNEDVPSQKNIETKIIGKWKRIKLDGVEHSTNMRQIATFENGGKMYSTTTMTATGKSIWEFQAPFDYECIGSTVRSRLYFEDGTLRSEMQYEVQEINETVFKVRMFRTYSDGAYKDINTLVEYRRINADYSQDIIGMWEGVEMTGDETYGDANHRIYYKEDGTYTYYDKVGDSWVPSKNAGNEYNVDGDWLAFRWCPVVGADYEYERWDIDEIKDGTMKWSALREKGDKTRYTTTFTWKKVNLPTQEEIETKIIGRWKKMKHDGKDAVTNKRTIWTFNNDGKGTQSLADYKEGDKTFIWDNKEPIQYSIQGNTLHSISPDVEHTATIPFINDNQMTMHVTKIISRGVDVKESYVAECSKVTADYS